MPSSHSTCLKYPNLRYCSIETRSPTFINLKARKSTLSLAPQLYCLDTSGVEKLYDFTLGTLFFKTFIDRNVEFNILLLRTKKIILVNSWKFPNSIELPLWGREGNRSRGRKETKVRSSQSP